MWRKIFTGRERRSFVRIPVALKIDFKINEESPDTSWHKGTTKNVSPEGICLVTDLFTKGKWEEIA